MKLRLIRPLRLLAPDADMVKTVSLKGQEYGQH